MYSRPTIIMPPTVYVKPEVTDEPMEDAADLALSDEAVKPEPSAPNIQPQPPWTGPAPPQQACESQFQITMPPNPFPPPPAAPPQSANCSSPSTGSIAEYYNPSGQASNSQSPEEKRHQLQDYHMQLMLLEQQNKKRLMMARQEQDSIAMPPKQEAQSPLARQGQEVPKASPNSYVQTPTMAKQDLCIQSAQSVLAEQQCKERLLKARREQDSMTIPRKQEDQNPSQKKQDHTLQAHQMQLMLLEQQNKKRRMMARQEQARQEEDSKMISPKQEDQTSDHTKEDYHTQLRLLEQQNKKRLIMARREQDAMATPPKQEDNTPNLAEADYQRQLELLELENKKRLVLARQEQDAMLAPPKQQGILSKMEEQVTALEQYNKKRLALARQEHYGLPLPTEQRTKLLAKWESDYQRQLQDAAEPAEKRGQQDKLLGNWEDDYQRELREAMNPPQASPPQQQPQFVDWEAQARAHIGVGPKDTLSPENQKKVDDIIKQKYQQVWGISDKEDNGQKASDPPVIQTYQEQLRAQKMTQQQKMLLQQQIQRLKQGSLAWATSSSPSASQNGPTIEERAATAPASMLPEQRRFTPAEINSVRNHPSGKMLNATDDMINMFLNKRQQLMNQAQQEQIPNICSSASGSKTRPTLEKRGGFLQYTGTTKAGQDESTVEKKAALSSFQQQQAAVLAQAAEARQSGSPVVGGLPDSWIFQQQRAAQAAKDRQSGSTVEQQVTPCFQNNTAARHDFESQLRLLKQQNVLRQQQMANAIAQQQNTMTQQQQNAIKQHHQQAQALHSQAFSQGNYALQDYETQMRLLEQQNKKRLSMAQQENQSRKRMMMDSTVEKKDPEQPAEAQSDKTSDNATASESAASGNCWCGIKMARSSCCVARNLENPIKRVSDYPSSSGHALQDYQTQLMQLEQNRIKANLPSYALPHQGTMMMQNMEKSAQAAAVAQLVTPAQYQLMRMQVQIPQVQGAQRQAQAQAMHLQQQQQRFRQLQAQQAAQQNDNVQKLKSATTTEEKAANNIWQEAKDENVDWMLEGLFNSPNNSEPQKTCPYGMVGSQHPSTPNQTVLAATHEQCPYGLARWQHPGQQPTPAQPILPWMQQPLATHTPSDPRKPIYTPHTFSTPSYLPPLYGSMADFAPADNTGVYGLPIQQPMPYPTPAIDLTQKDKSSSSSATPSPIKSEFKEDIYRAGTEASDDSDWSRLSTPTEDDDFVVVEHGALPIRPARPDETS